MGVAMLFLVGLSLSMDAFAVSITNAMCYVSLNKKQACIQSACFGLFQGIMPIIGFFMGRMFKNLIEAVDHWVALVLLACIGGKMLYEGIKALQSPESCPANPQFGMKTMLTQALATSIDALAVGIGFAALAVNIWAAAGIIAATTFCCCVVGGLLGRRFGAILGDWAQIFGGLVLVGIGIKIFVEHMLAA